VCGNGSMAQQAAATDWAFCLSHFTTLATTIWTLKVTISLCVIQVVKCLFFWLSQKKMTFHKAFCYSPRVLIKAQVIP